LPEQVADQVRRLTYLLHARIGAFGRSGDDIPPDAVKVAQDIE
jgi:hypothetical protein